MSELTNVSDLKTRDADLARYEAQAGPVARLVGVSKSFDGVDAVVDATLEVYPGQIVAVLGPNGAGKTTSLHCLLGLRRPNSGLVELLGGSPTSSAVRARCGVVLQDSGLPGSLKVREHVELYRSFYADPMPTEEVLELVGVSDLAERFFGELSGGQQQRVYVALAMCGRPRVLFLDEPSVGLDNASRRRLWETIRTVAAKGTAVLLTTHYMEEADALADRIVLFAAGRTVYDGSAQEMKSNFSRRTISLRPSGAPDIRRLQELGAEDVLFLDGNLSMTSAHSGRVLKALLEADPDSQEIVVQGVTLEEAVEEVLRQSPPQVATVVATADRAVSPVFRRDRVTAWTWLRMVRAQTRAEFLKLRRDLAFILTTCLLPTLFFAFFGLSRSRHSDPEALAYTVASFSAYGAIGVGLFSFGVGIAAERGLKWDTLIRATPMPSSAYLAARVVPAGAFTLLTLVVLAVFATLTTDVSIGLGSWVVMILGLTAGSTVFIAMGLALGYNMSPRSAGPVSTMVYLVLSFASGLFVPMNQLPTFAASVAPFLPTWHFARIGWGALGLSPGFGITSLLVLLGYTVFFAALAAVGYRRELRTRFL